MPLEVEVISQVRQLYHTETADMVIVPGSEGELGVLPNHAPALLLCGALGARSVVPRRPIVGAQP